MVGNKSIQDKLNFSLIRIANIFKKNKFDNRFIAYGTSPGIVRNK